MGGPRHSHLTPAPIMGTVVPVMGAMLKAPESSVGTALFGATRQAVLRTLFGHWDRRFYLRQIIRLAGVGSGGPEPYAATRQQAHSCERHAEAQAVWLVCKGDR